MTIPTPLHWDTRYETGIEEIDLQHRYFLALINRLRPELMGARDAAYRRRLIDELIKYASFHFLSEENMMFKFGYPDLEAHRVHHFDLLEKLSVRAAGRSEEDLFGFLVDWFVHHTTEEDRRIGEFVLGAAAPRF